MKIRKLIMIICLIAGIIFLGIGITMIVKPLQTDTLSSEELLEKQVKDNDKKYGITRNYNQKIKNRKCTENICVDELNIIKQATIYAITGNIINETTEIISDQSINLIFTINEQKEIKKTIYITNIEPKSSIPLEIQFLENEKELLDATEYRIEKVKD